MDQLFFAITLLLFLIVWFIAIGLVELIEGLYKKLKTFK